MSKTRIYLADDGDMRLIRAKNKAQVRQRILAGINIEVASQDALIDLAMNNSVPIEDATAEPTSEDDDNE